MIASFALKERKRRRVLKKRRNGRKSCVRDDDVYPLWHDGVVILKDEPLNLMSPETLLFHRLGLEQQALLI